MQRRALVHAAAWTLATGAAVTLSWFGVHTVLTSTAYDRPRALSVADRPTSQATTPQASSTHRPKPSPSAGSSSSESPGEADHADRGDTGEKSEGNDGQDGRGSGNDAEADGSSSGDGANGDRASGGSRHSTGPERRSSVKSTTVDGGRAVFEVRSDSAALVSATPNAGWDMTVWKADTWIRVTFANGERRSTIFCRWGDSRPRIETFAD